MRAVFLFIKTEPGHVTDVANRVAEIDSFSEAYSISGPYDLLVKLYVDDVEKVGRLVETQVHSVPHIRETHTILTFEAFRGGG
jgi:DNA-binding Lrp family transcriptional regulator